MKLFYSLVLAGLGVDTSSVEFDDVAHFLCSIPKFHILVQCHFGLHLVEKVWNLCSNNVIKIVVNLDLTFNGSFCKFIGLEFGLSCPDCRLHSLNLGSSVLNFKLLN